MRLCFSKSLLLKRISSLKKGMESLTIFERLNSFNIINQRITQRNTFYQIQTFYNENTYKIFIYRGLYKLAVLLPKARRV
jgi:hypothetical protein